MYNTYFNTTYNVLDGDDGDTLYRKELLMAFNLNEFDLDILNKRILVLYAYLQHKMNKNDITWFNSILTQLSSKYMSTDKEFGFMLLFSFDKFYIIHNFLKSYLSYNKCDKTDLMKIFSK
tara:strand:- start:215 stop:574 length:360 start_codon:yes stop_codon:yes gene_type:complete